MTAAENPQAPTPATPTPPGPGSQEPSQVQQIITQTVDMDAQRYKFFRGFIRSKATAVVELIGNGDNAPLSETDEGVYEDGVPDIDFEESTVEILIEIERTAVEIAQMAVRFRHNVTMRIQRAIEAEQQAQLQALQAPAKV